MIVIYLANYWSCDHISDTIKEISKTNLDFCGIDSFFQMRLQHCSEKSSTDCFSKND